MNNQKLYQISQNICFFSIAAGLLLIPLFFLPLTTDFFGFNKQILFFILTAITLFSYLLSQITQKSLRLTLSPLLLPLFILTVVSSLSIIIHPFNKIDAWISRGFLYISLFIFYSVASTLITNARQIKKLLHILLISVSLAAIQGLISSFNLFQNSNLASYLKSTSFSLTGSPLILIQLLIITLPLALILAFKSKPDFKKLLYFLCSGLILSTILIIGSQLLPNQTNAAILLPQKTGWFISLESVKNNPLLGSGPGSFLTAFQLYRPAYLNTTSFWQIDFTNSSNLYFHLFTTLGFSGLTALFLIIYGFYKTAKRKKGTRITSLQMAVHSSIITAFILALFFPFTAVIWIMLVYLFSFATVLYKTKQDSPIKDILLNLNTFAFIDPNSPQPTIQTSSSIILPIFLTLVSAALIIILGFHTTKLYKSEYYLQKSFEAASQNQGNLTYNLQIKALDLSPNIDRYHLAYANTNLALANSLASQNNLSDQDQQALSQLIQQAIREAKIATELNPQKANNWATLGQIYRSLINFAQNADQFAISAYIRAIQLNPTNPILRVNLGGIFYGLEQYDQALDRFSEAIQLKPDYANAYYNLSAALQKLNKPLEAYQAMQQVVTLLPSDSADYQKATQELEELKTKLPQTPTEKDQIETKQITPPTSPLPAPSGFEKINLQTTPSASPR